MTIKTKIQIHFHFKTNKEEYKHIKNRGMRNTFIPKRTNFDIQDFELSDFSTDQKLILVNLIALDVANPKEVKKFIDSFKTTFYKLKSIEELKQRFIDHEIYNLVPTMDVLIAEKNVREAKRMLGVRID